MTERTADLSRTSHREKRKQQTPEEFRRDLQILSGTILGAGSVAALLYALQFNTEEALSVLGGAGAVACASAAVGSLLGFLFGIPKTLQSDQIEIHETKYLANTNLEQISDWLTKILVGIGLVQIARTPDALSHLSVALGPLFGDEATSPAFGLSLSLYFTVAGFVVAYLWTRALLRGVLEAADRDLKEQIEDVLSEREVANAAALALVDRQLTGQAPLPSQEELDKAMIVATPDFLVQIYRKAEDLRDRHWRLDPVTMARTIPVFRALTAADKERRFYRHFAGLGYALKDQPNPQRDDYVEALQAFTSAIAIRGKGNALTIFEWNRAVCRIRLDPKFAAGQPSDQADAELIKTDLRRAAKQFSAAYFTAHPDDPDKTVIADWMALNSVTYDDIKP